MKGLGKLFSFGIDLVYVAVFLLSLLILGVSLLTTVVFRQNEQNDLFDFTAENIPLLLLSMVVVFLLMLFVQAAAKNHGKKQNMGLLSFRGGRRQGKKEENGEASLKTDHPAFPWVMMIFGGAISLFLVLVIRGNPTADASQLDEIINQFMEGDYSALEPGEYLDVYPFQIPYVYIGELIAHVVGQSNYLVWQLISVIAVEVILYFLYQITWELFENKTICRIEQILSCGMFVLFVFSTFIYLDVWSIAVQTLAVYWQILYMKRDKIRYEVLAGIGISFACLMKGNSLIALIAMVIMLIVDAVWKWVKHRRGVLKAVLLCVMLGLMTSALSSAVDAYTLHRTGIDEIPTGLPTEAYLAMGMQTAEGKCGWYNGVTRSLYTESGYDTEKTKELALIEIDNAIAEFDNSGRYFVNFYFQKFISQWGDSTCVSMKEMENTERHVEHVSELANSLIFGTGNKILSWVMNVEHSMIYLGMVIYCAAVLWGKRKDKERGRRFSSEEAMIVIFIFGGMLFHEIWEASGRYIMRYYFAMLPLASWGWSFLVEFVLEKGKEAQKRHLAK